MEKKLLLNDKKFLAYQTAKELVPHEQIQVWGMFGDGFGRKVEFGISSVGPEERAKVPPPNLFVDYMNEGLIKKGLTMDEDFKVAWVPNSFPMRKGETPIEEEHYNIHVDFPGHLAMADEKMKLSCELLTRKDRWKEGLSGNQKKSESKLFKIGQRLVPNGVDPCQTNFEWYFITSYRAASGIGVFRLLRIHRNGNGEVKRRLSSVPGVTPCYDDECYDRPSHLAHNVGVWGWLLTDHGGSFSLEGDHFIRSTPVRHGPSFPSCDLKEHLKGLRIISIGGEDLGDEAGVVAHGDYLTDLDKANEYFGLAQYGQPDK